MGLLDDAIREHLELKRQRGADPDEVAREERAALASLRAEEDPVTMEPLADEDLGRALAEDDGEHDPDSDYHADLDLAPGPSNAIEETAEIDMRTVLETADSEGEEAWEMPDREARGARATPATAKIEPPPSSTPGVEDDPLAQEAPATRGRLFKRRAARG